MQKTFSRNVKYYPLVELILQNIYVEKVAHVIDF